MFIDSMNELDNVKKDEEVEVVEILNDWVKIKRSNEQEGWIRKEKLTTIKEKIANKVIRL